MDTLIIAGGSGFLGQVIANHFKPKTNRIIILTRSQSHIKNGFEYVNWDAKTMTGWEKHFENADVLINLTGKSVDCRYNETNKNLIYTSRIDSTQILGKAIAQCLSPPKVWFNSSTATIYAHSMNKQNDEFTGDIGEGFSVNIAKSWEKAFFSFKLKNTRQIALRTSIVLGKDGGALQPIVKMTKLGLGGKQGNGKQKVSWIHEVDFVRSIDFLIENTALDGTINIVASEPTTNNKLMKTIRRSLNIPFGIMSPKWLLEFGARIINTETELILKSRNVIPTRLTQAGFKYQYPELDKAINHLLN